MSNNQRRNNYPRGGRGGRGGHGARDQQNKHTFQGKKLFERKFKEENRKELSLYKKEVKDSKEFKVKLEGDDTEKVNLPTYEDDNRDETLLILVKELNMMVDDGDLLKEENIGL